MLSLRLAGQKFEFRNLQPGDGHTIENYGWLADVLADGIFDESELRQEHHALLDALKAAEAKRHRRDTSIADALEENRRARLEALGNGGSPPALLDGTELMRERDEAIDAARLRLYTFADDVRRRQLDHYRKWADAAAERERKVDAKLAKALRAYEVVCDEKQEAVGMLRYVKAMHPQVPNRSHGVVAYDLCTRAPEPPPPEPMQMPRTGMEGQIVQVT
jgi:hypothetical protein